MTIDSKYSDMFSALNSKKVAIQIQKMSLTTRIDDCSEPLWKLTGFLDRKDRCPHDRPYPLIKDLSYPVWRCRIGMKHADKWHYGKTIYDAISKSLNHGENETQSWERKE